jgi:hypothetical protein
MKAQFKYLSFIGTALLIATGSTAAFAQSSRDNNMNMSNNVCSYTPQNRYCIGTNYQNRMMNSSDSMTRQNMNMNNSGSSSQMNQPSNSGSSSQMNQPSNSGSESPTPVRNTDSGVPNPATRTNQQQ